MRAVVTAGGTSEPIDDVRVVTNLSTGRFGAAIASALAHAGLNVTLLAGRALATHPEWVDPRVRVVRFGSFADLDQALTDATRDPVDLLFMAAAVSDYSPVPADGKIRSDQDELVIRMKRNPKLLATLRERCGQAAFLVGFKLLSGVTPADLVATARRQLAGNHLNLVVANDLRELAGAEHPLWLVTPEGGALRRTGTKAEVANALVDFALTRRAVTWHRSVPTGASPVPDDDHRRASALLAFAIEAGLLPGTDGNVSHRASGGLWTTPRQVPKAALTGADLVHAAVDPVARTVAYSGARKASIDTPVAAWLYRQLPALQGLVHFHDGLVLETGTTAFPWPCGSLEEAEEIAATLLRAGGRGWDGGGFAVELVDHGFLVGTTDADALIDGWRAGRAGYRDHLRDIGVDQDPPRLEPILDADRVVGACAGFPVGEGEAWSTWLWPAARGSGRGDRVAERLDRLGRRALVGDRCEVVDWYRERGWAEIRRQGPFAVLEPPSRRTGWIEAASVCLLDPVRRRVLLGRRTAGAWAGYWAFPGGKRDPTDPDLLATALRELHEETGIALESARSLRAGSVRERRVYAGDFAVTNHLVLVLACPEPSPSAELDARWVGLDEARTLRPMAAGTRRVLRGLDEVRG